MPENEPNAPRFQKWVKVYYAESNVVCEGMLLDDAEIHRLALHDCMHVLERAMT